MHLPLFKYHQMMSEDVPLITCGGQEGISLLKHCITSLGSFRWEEICFPWKCQVLAMAGGSMLGLMDEWFGSGIFLRCGTTSVGQAVIVNDPDLVLPRQWTVTSLQNVGKRLLKQTSSSLCTHLVQLLVTGDSEPTPLNVWSGSCFALNLKS